MRKLHTLTLTVITVTRHSRPKPGHSNSRVFCKQIDRVLKMRFNERLPRLYGKHSRVMEVFKEPVLLLFGEKNHT